VTPGRSATPSKRAQMQHFYEASHAFGTLPVSPYRAASVVPAPASPDAAPRVRKLTLDTLGVGEPTEEMLRAMFDEFDVSGDGLLDRAEFKAVVQGSFENYGAPMSDRDIERLFNSTVRPSSRAGRSMSPAGGQSKATETDKITFDQFCLIILARMRL
jgi:hypothetical protein